MSNPFEKPVSFLLCNATANTYNDAGFLLFDFTPTAQCAVNLLLSLVADAAGIQQNQIRICRFIGERVICPAHDLCDPFRVILIHLTAVGLNIQFLHGTMASITL